MRSARYIFLLTALLFSASLCFGHKYLVDSVDAITKERVRIAVINIGDVDSRKFGKLYIERIGNTWALNIPIVQYLDMNAALSMNDTLPAGTAITIKCGTRKTVNARTMEHTRPFWYCHWFYWPFKPEENMYIGTSSTRATVYLSNIPFWKRYHWEPWDVNDLYAISWPATFEINSDDIRFLSRRPVQIAYINRNGTRVYLRLKKRQARKMQHAIKAMLHR